MAKPSLPLANADRIEQLARGGYDLRRWYPRAIEEIAYICGQENWNATEFARVLALLSPQVAIRRNVRLALAYIGQGEFMRNTSPTIKRSVEIYKATGEINGPKVGAFAAALTGDKQAITLDTWMARAMLECEIEPNVKHFRRVATRAAAYELIRTVGKRLGICPRDTQAAVWCGMFREFGRTPQYFPLVEEYERWLAYGREFPTWGVIDDDSEPLADDEF